MIKFIAYAVLAQMALRILSEILLTISLYTKSNFDNKLAAYASQLAWVIGIILGKFGYGMPNKIIKGR